MIGGGGGLHQPLRSGEGCFDDLCSDYKPLFHYLSIRRGEDGLQVTSIELKNDFTTFEQGVHLKIGGLAPTDAMVHTVTPVNGKGSAQ